MRAHYPLHDGRTHARELGRHGPARGVGGKLSVQEGETGEEKVSDRARRRLPKLIGCMADVRKGLEGEQNAAIVAMALNHAGHTTSSVSGALVVRRSMQIAPLPPARKKIVCSPSISRSSNDVMCLSSLESISLSQH